MRATLRTVWYTGSFYTQFFLERTLKIDSLTVNLLMIAAVAYPVGIALDQYGGRALMTLGSVGGGLLLIAWARIETLPQFYVMWLTLGVCMGCCLMEPLMAVSTIFS